MEKRLENVKSAPAETTEKLSHEETLGLYRKKKESDNKSRQSKTTQMFQEYAKTSMLGVSNTRRPDGSITPHNPMTAKHGGKNALSNAEVQRSLQQQEENYIDIIYKLQHDRLTLRGKNVTDRLNNLQKSEAGLNAFIKDNKEKKELKIKLSRESENKITKAAENVDSLRQNIKMQMA